MKERIITLTIIVENQLHKPIADAIFDSSGAIERMCTESNPQNPLSGVDPASDTMFNEYQVNMILDYLGTSDASEKLSSQNVQVLRSAAEIAARKGGYLWFRGSPAGDHGSID